MIGNTNALLSNVRGPKGITWTRSMNSTLVFDPMIVLTHVHLLFVNVQQGVFCAK